MSALTFTTFAEVQNALQTFIQTNNIAVGPPHGAFWEEQYSKFVTGDVFAGGPPALQPGSGKDSNIIKALSGIAPFDGSTYPQMPPNGPYLDQGTIDAISHWIDAGAKE